MSYRLVWNDTIDSRKCCDAYQESMKKIMKQNDKVVHIDCDLMGCIDTKIIKEAYPDRVFNAGIAEANAVGVACGLAATGMIPFVHSFGVFASRRVFDQLFLSAGYSRWPVHVIGSDPGITAAYNGATHMPFEDCATYLTMPNATIIDPVDYAQTFALTKKLVDVKELSYMRLIRKNFKTVYADDSDFEIGKGVVLKEGKDVTIIASGIMVSNALKAEEILRKQGIDASVIDMHTWKPLDTELIVSQARKTGAMVTAENHQLSCGLGSAIANVLIENCPIPMEMIGIREQYGQCGPQDVLEKEYKMSAEDIVEACIRAIKRKADRKD